MSTKFRTVITTAGAAKLAAAIAPGGRKVKITTMAVGDGGGKLPVPDAGQTGLIHEVWRHALNKISQDKRNSNYIIAELVIPPEVGGFWMRELGLYDDAGTLIAVANMAESYKPALAEGSGRSQTCRMVIIVSSVASVALTIDTTTVMATQDYVDDKIAEHEQSRRHPDASLTAKGFTQLSSATNSTSETLAATPKAVKAAYDLANGKYTAQDATTARKGLVQLSSATNSMSETLAATPKAVKTVMDETNKKAPLNSPALTGTPTTPTARQGTNNTQIANTAFVMAAIAALVDSSPDALNTLNELAAALGNDPNFATTMTNALAGKQPKDATLTALAGLATAADRFPYFTGNDTASLATLTKVGRDILAKSTVAAVIEYLGLQETVNLAAGAVPSVRRVNGYPLSADIALTAKDVSAIPERGALGDTNLNTLTGSKFGRYFQQYTAKATTANNYPVNVAGALDIIQNGAGNAEGCTQEYRPYHSNVCYRRFYRGDSNVWSSWEYDFTSAGGAINGFVEIAGDNRTITIKPKTANQWYSLFGRKADNTNHFYIGQGANNSDTIQFHNYLTNSRISLVRGGVDVLGKIIPSDFSNFDSRYVKDVRLGTRVVQIMRRGVMYEKPGHVITGIGIIGEVDGDDPAVFRPIQKHINGTWYNVSQV